MASPPTNFGDSDVMVIRLEKPLIEKQLEIALELVERVRDRRLVCVFIFGPKGIGKTKVVESAYRGSGVHLTPIFDATLYGLRHMFEADPAGHFWLDDNDHWMTDRREVNFLKGVLQHARIGAINAATLRAATRDGLQSGVRQVQSDNRLVVTSNASTDALSPEQRNHVEAVIDQGRRIDISSDPVELLRFLDWWVVEGDYFSTEMFRAEANINRRLSLREIQDVLNFIHTYAWRLPLSLRMLRETAVERMVSPDDWHSRLIAGLTPEPALKIAPHPAPEMFGHNARNGRPRQPTGFERREAKRSAKQTAQQTAVASDPAPETMVDEVNAGDVDEKEPQPASPPQPSAEADPVPSAGLSDPDELPKVLEQPISRAGDLWIMGRHRLLVGDSTSAIDVARLMHGKLADGCCSSPPYLNQRDYENIIDDWDSLMQGAFGNLLVKPDAQILVNLGLVHRNGEWLNYWDAWIEWMRQQGWRRFALYTWDKGSGLPGDWHGRLAPAHENIFHFNKLATTVRKTVEKKPQSVGTGRYGLRGKDGRRSPARRPELGFQAQKIPDSVLRVFRHNTPRIEHNHPAIAPVALFEQMMLPYSSYGDLWFEPFTGSGTAIIAAERLGLVCYGMEIVPRYADVAVLRVQAFTGEQAVLEGDGRTFADICAERNAKRNNN